MTLKIWARRNPNSAIFIKINVENNCTKIPEVPTIPKSMNLTDNKRNERCDNINAINSITILKLILLSPESLFLNLYPISFIFNLLRFNAKISASILKPLCCNFSTEDRMLDLLT